MTWNSLLLGYVENGRGDLTLELFRGLHPNAGTFLGAIKACSSMADSEESTIVIGSGKVKLSALEKGMIRGDQGAFDRMEFHTVVFWNGNGEGGGGGVALELFERVSCEKNALTFAPALKACSSLAAREDQRQVHGRLVKVVAFERGTRVHAQVSMIRRLCSPTHWWISTKCGSMTDARRVYDSMECQKAAAWNALMFGYCEYGEAGTVLELFDSMKTSRGCAPTSRSYVATLKACTSVAGKEVTRKIDGRAVKLASLEKGMALYAGGHTTDCFVGITFAHGALDLSTTMEEEGFEPDMLTFVVVAKACIGLAAKEEARQVDGKLVKVFTLDKGKTVHSQATKSSATHTCTFFCLSAASCYGVHRGKRRGQGCGGVCQHET